MPGPIERIWAWSLELRPLTIDSASAVALNVTNRFISAYRHVVGDAFVTRIDSGQMFLFRAHARYSDGAIDGLMTSNYPSGITLATTGLVDEIEERFSKVLADGHLLAAWNELMLDAVDALDRNELASAVALGFAAVETGSRAICRTHFRSEGLSISAAQQLAKEWGERGRVAQFTI